MLHNISMGIKDENSILKDKIPSKCRTCANFHIIGYIYNDLKKYECSKRGEFVDSCEYWEAREKFVKWRDDTVKDILCEIRDKLTAIETMLIEENKNAPK